MLSPHKLGKKGEHLAGEYLLAGGYQILERNWRYRRAEIDLIVQQEEILIFVEVKTRSNNEGNAGERAVNASKKALLSNAAAAYMEQVGHEWEIRFDLIVIEYRNAKDHTLLHYKDAFFPGWNGH